MSVPPAALVVLCTCPDRVTAERLARAAVSAGLAACVNILPGLTSIYRWQGAIECAEEVLLLAKTTLAVYPQLEALWRAQHPYELPEVLAVPVTIGSEPYVQWLSDALARS